MRKISTILILFFTTLFVSAQVNALVKKFFFDLPSHDTKFDIRIKLNESDNFSGLQSSGDVWWAEFKNHPYITNLPNSVEVSTFGVNFNYDGANIGLSRNKSIRLSYEVSKITECKNQYKEIIKLFKPYTKGTRDTYTVDGNSEGVDIYPVAGANFSFISVDIIFRPKATYMYSIKNEHYELNITLYEDPLTRQ